MAAILSFLIAWFYSALAGALFLAALWFWRSMADRGRRSAAAEAVAAPPPAPAAEPEPVPAEPPAPTPDEVVERRRAVRVLREAATDQSAEALAKRLEEETDDAVRLDIVVALRALRRPLAIDALVHVATTENFVDWSIRENALKALAEMGDARVIPPLVASLGQRWSQDEEIQAALSAFGRDARPALEEGLRNPRAAVRARCAESLAQIGSTESAPSLAPLLDAREPRVREAAAAALGMLRATDFAPALLSALDEPSWEVRAAAARALGLLGSRAAVPRLIARTGDPHDEVARAATESLALLRDPAAGPALVALLQGEWLRVEAGAALLAIGDGESATLLRPLLVSDDVPLALAALDLVAALQDRRATSDVAALVGREDADVRVAALLALARLGDPAACPDVVNCLADADARVRAAAVLAAGRLGCAADLRGALADRDPRVRSAACEALRTAPPPADVVIPLLGDSSEDVRAAAAALLQADAPPAAIAALAALLHDAEPRVVREGARALGRVGQQGWRALAAELPSLDWHAQQHCAGELVAAGGAAVELLAGVARHAEPLVRFCAVSALRRSDAPAAHAVLETMRSEEPDARVRELLGSSRAAG